jgi:hypothetical protein
MHTKIIIAAAVSTLAASAAAAPYDAPYALTAVHAEFQAQLEHVATAPGEIGTAARLAAELMATQNAEQERLVMPLLGHAEVTATRQALTDVDLPGHAQRLEAELSQLSEGDAELVAALVELYAAAEDAGQAEIARLAERIIWHETSDVEVLYPAALLVRSVAKAR